MAKNDKPKTNEVAQKGEAIKQHHLMAMGKMPKVLPSPKDRKSTRLNSSHVSESRMPSSA